MGKYYIIILYSFFSLNLFAQGSVSADIIIGNDLDATLEIEFSRKNIDSSRFYVTSINIDNYVRHKEPVDLKNKKSDEKNIKNILSGSWYSQENNDLIIGAFLAKGENKKNIVINLPDPIFRDFEANKSIFIRKSDNEIKKYLTNDYIVYKKLDKVNIKFKEKELFKIEEIENLNKAGTLEFELDFIKNNYGTIKYRPVSYFNGVEWMPIVGLGLLFAYIIFIALLDEKINKKALKICYFLIFVAGAVSSYLLKDSIDKIIWLMLFSVASSTFIVFIFSLTPERIFRIPLSVIKSVKDTSG